MKNLTQTTQTTKTTSWKNRLIWVLLFFNILSPVIILAVELPLLLVHPIIPLILVQLVVSIVMGSIFSEVKYD